MQYYNLLFFYLIACKFYCNTSGSRKAQNLFESASLPEGGFITDIPEITVIAGAQMDTFALKTGYRFCTADITIPGTPETVKIDLSGFFISMGIIAGF